MCREGVKQGRLLVMASGADLPVIDLRRVDPDLCAALIDNQVRVAHGKARERGDRR
jgi:hypothetical protein